VLKKANRLKSQRDFKRTLSGKRLCSNDCFVLYGLFFRADTMKPVSGDLGSQDSRVRNSVLPGQSQPRIGFVVSKKVHKRANRRNLVKRRMREMVRLALLSQTREKLVKYRSLVFVARSRSVETPFPQLRQKMEACFRQL